MHFKPMKPPTGVLEDCDLHKVRFPVIASPKLDGIRMSCQDSRLVSSTLKDIPNIFVRMALSRPELEGLDGEGTVGSLTDGECFRRSTSLIMSDDHPVTEPMTFNVFDKFSHRARTAQRQAEALAQINALRSKEVAPNIFVRWVSQVVVQDLAQFLAFERMCVDTGYEGAMYRNPDSLYKQGRATLTDQQLMRRKPTVDAEALVIGVCEEQENTNAAYTNELGRTKRSSAKAGKVGKGTLGGFEVRGLTAFPGVDFHIGAFGNQEECAYLWANRSSLPGKILKFKYQKYGSVDKPRIPIALGFRDARDM